MKTTIIANDIIDVQADEQSIIDKALTVVGHGLVTGYAATTHVLAQASVGIEQSVRATPDIWKAGRASARANVSNILAKYTK